MLTFPIAFLLILIFAILSKRTSFMRGKCKGYFAPVLPLDFYVHIKRKFAAVIFAIVADELLFIIRQVLTDNSSSNQGLIEILFSLHKQCLIFLFQVSFRFMQFE